MFLIGVQPTQDSFVRRTKHPDANLFLASVWGWGGGDGEREGARHLFERRELTDYFSIDYFLHLVCKICFSHVGG